MNRDQVPAPLRRVVDTFNDENPSIDSSLPLFTAARLDRFLIACGINPQHDSED